MRTVSKERQRELYQLAASQGGYFTTKQATSLGYQSNKRAYHVHAGNWIREHRGIYRLALFPEPEHPDLIVWWLWSRNRSDHPVGVFSHQTALSLHEISDVNPSKLDMTVPGSFRRGAPIPKILRLHYGCVPQSQREILFEVPVTNALRTVFDIWRDNTLPKPLLREAFQQAVAAGKITQEQIAQALADSEYGPIVRALKAKTA